MEPDDLKPSNGFAKTICAICFEELKPVIEDLQSISLCGHVFHELCLQQWFEYCPSGKKNTCPVCKQQCSQKCVGRLYFQSLGESTQATEKFRCFDASQDDVVALRGELTKLGGQLTAVNHAFGQQQQRLKELMIELSVAKDRAAKEEALKVEAIKEKTALQQLLKRKTEELVQLNAECSKVQERSLALAKELAAHKLVSNMDLDEEEITRLASVGHATNREDIIVTLRRSLVLRNKSYKELMVQCNRLGREGQSSQKKLEKAVKKIEKLKERLKELERAVEDEDNDVLRTLKLKASKRVREEGVDEYGVKLSFNDLNNCKSKMKMESSTVSSESYYTYFLPNVSTDSGALLANHSSHVQGNSVLPKCQSASGIKIGMEEVDSETEMGTTSHSPVRLGKPRIDPKSCMVSQYSKKPEDSKHLSAVEPTVLHIDTSGGLDKDRKSVLTGSLDLSYTDDGNHGRRYNQDDESLLITLDDDNFIPIVKEKATSLVNPVTDPVDQCFHNGLIGSNVASRPTGKWCRQGQTVPKFPSAMGQLIAVGADGRGGSIKVLRNQSQLLASKQQPLWTKPSKRWTDVNKQNGQAQGCLQIEHFFAKSGS